jgi:hypothetical protein
MWSIADTMLCGADIQQWMFDKGLTAVGDGQ